MYSLRLAFRHDAKHDLLIVESEVYLSRTSLLPDFTAQTVYGHENTFLCGLIAADLDYTTTRKLAVAAILAVANPQRAEEWITVRITEEQNKVLGLKLTQTISMLPGRAHPFSFLENTIQFHDLLLNSPTPFAMVSGPEYILTFINQPYVQILGRTSSAEILGRPLLEAVPELCGQPCLTLLRNAYNTGLPQFRTELKSTVREEDTGLSTEVYFDIVYHPVRDANGHIYGVMAQATDVTERVLARQVMEHREQQLFRLWAELETIYQASHVGIAVLDVAGLKLLRMNTLQAEFFGGKPEAFLGRNLTCAQPQLAAWLHRAASGEAIHTTMQDGQGGSWEINILPTRNMSGDVETLTLITHATVVAEEEEYYLATA